MKFDGKVAVVTGAGSKRGIGRETALALAERGADVVVADMDLEGAKRVAGEIEALGRRALALPVNVTDEASVESMFAEAEKALLSNLTAQTNALYKATDRLEAVLKAGDEGADMLERARYTRDQVITAMDEVRAAGDALEGIVGKSYWPMPTYQDLLTSV